MTAHDPLHEALAERDEPVQPSSEFSDRLRRRLQATVDRASADDGVASRRLIPYLTVSNARRAMDFYSEVFGAEVSGSPILMDDGRVGHAELHVGGNTFYLADEFPEIGLVSPLRQEGRSNSFVVEVRDADATFDHAVEAGASIDQPVSEGHGVRSGWVIDEFGHRWSPTSPITFAAGR